MEVMIAYPPIEGVRGTPMLGQNRQYQVFHNPSYIYPMVPASAATLLKENGCEVMWLDGIAQRLTYRDFLRKFCDAHPDVVAIETKTPVVQYHWGVIEELKCLYPDTKVVLMGDHVTYFPEESLHKSKADYVITGGDYDFALNDISRHLNGQISIDEALGGIWYREGLEVKNTGNFDLKGDLDRLPFIDRDLTKWRLYGEKFYKRPPFTYTMAGRDCQWAKCSFCSWTALYPKFRRRSVENVLDEIGHLIENYGVREIFDDTGTFPAGEWLSEFCQGMIARGYNKRVLFSCNFRFDFLKRDLARLMKKAGFRLLKLGLESANDQTLQLLSKGTTAEDIIWGCRIAKDAGLEVHLTIMVGYPWETRQDAERTYRLARRLMTGGFADMLQATMVVPYPGTGLYEEALRNNWFRFRPQEYERYDMQEPLLETPDMAPEEVVRLCDKIYRIFLSPRFFMRYVKKIKSPEDIAFIGRGAKAVLGHILDFLRAR